MSAPGCRIWVMPLIGVMLVLVGDSLESLMLTMETFDHKNFCGNLNCRIKDSSEEGFFIITSLTIYNISRSDERFEIAAVKNDGNGIKINQSKTSEVVGAGCINRYDADLSVSLINPYDCYFGKFLCELDYIDTDGHSDTIITDVKAENASNDFNCGAVKSQLFAASTQLSALRQDNTNLSTELSALRQDNTNLSTQLSGLRQDNTALSTELSAIRIQYSVLLLQFQNLSSQVSPTQHYLTSVLTSPSKTVTTTSPATTRITTPALGSECSRGMSHSNPRIKFLLWGQIPALCDTETDGGGWVIIQRRTKGDVDFYRDWESYKTGFGTPDTDFWLGNDVIHNLTLRGYSELRVDMIFNKSKFYAQYDVFAVDNENQNYRLTVSGYRGDAGDSLAYHNNMMFSTYNRDNDKYPGNCATLFRGAWWYTNCSHSNLNGVWGVNNDIEIIWGTLTNPASLTFTEMKVRLWEI